jgi:hypothetical protein
LKFTNPDAWYQKMQELEAQKNQNVEKRFAEVKEQAQAKTTEQLRLEALEKYNATAENKLTEEQLVNYTPPIWQQQVVSGDLAFDEFLQKASQLIYANQVVKTEQVEPTTNLNGVTGGDKDPQTKEGIDYSKITF